MPGQAVSGDACSNDGVASSGADSLPKGPCPMANLPNVLFILSDQHNARLLGCAGQPTVRTPNLDRMAAEGVRFANAITQNPICTPSRMCYLSGQYPHNHGYYGLSGPRPRGFPRLGGGRLSFSSSGPRPGGLPTVLSHFRRAGYRTAAIGRNHHYAGGYLLDIAQTQGSPRPLPLHWSTGRHGADQGRHRLRPQRARRPRQRRRTAALAAASLLPGRHEFHCLLHESG